MENAARALDRVAEHCRQLKINLVLENMTITSPGDGHIPWTELLDQLARCRFHGALILEIAGGEDSKLVLEGAQRARALLRKLASEIQAP